MFNIGGSEMVVLAVLALLVFGPEGLPGIIKNVMRTVNAVKIAARDFQTEVKTALDTENERQDLAKRRRTYVDKPQRDTPALAESAVPPMPEEEESSSSEQAGEESNSEEVLADDVSTESVSDQGPDPAEIAPEVEIAPGEESVALEEEPVALEDEPVAVDDDGPGIPMGRARRSKGSEKKVTETT